ncbi:MAG: hypothetical protein QM784_28925 [Polyangiaceae bacterium]
MQRREPVARASPKNRRERLRLPWDFPRFHSGNAIFYDSDNATVTFGEQVRKVRLATANSE